MNNKGDWDNASNKERRTFLVINVTTPNSMRKLLGNQSFKPFNQAKNGVMQGSRHLFETLHEQQRRLW
jgi:hypothetical protein